MHKVSISPVTRANAVGDVTVFIEDGKVVDAQNGTGIFKGFELIMEGRDPWDAPYLTQRICGICSSAHAMASCLALETIAQVEPPPNGVLVRNMIFGLDLLQNHLRHFYVLGLWDWVQPPDEFPFKGGFSKGFRFSPQESKEWHERYWAATEHSRLAHETLVLLGGKIPHNHGIIPGGVSLMPDGHVVAELRPRLQRIHKFVQEVYYPDALLLQDRYQDYLSLGVWESHFLSLGLFPHAAKDGHLFPSGVILDKKNEPVDLGRISESLAYAWYRGKGGSPWEEKLIPDPSKEEAYSWAKAPRYGGEPCEGGPLARAWIKGQAPQGNSAMDRIVARAREAREIVKWMDVWLNELMPGEPAHVSCKTPASGRGVGAIDAMRGPLSHWVTLKGGRISSYQIITPSAWNYSPRDEKGQLGPVEQALLNTPVQDSKEPIEVGRILRSFDPCYSCAAHVIDRVRGEKQVIQI